MSTRRPFLKILAKWEVAQRTATDNCISASVIKTQQDPGEIIPFSPTEGKAGGDLKLHRASEK